MVSALMYLEQTRKDDSNQMILTRNYRTTQLCPSGYLWRYMA